MATDNETTSENIVKPNQIVGGNSTNLIDEVYFGLTEETFFKSPMVPDSYDSPYNPDKIWRKNGDYSIYEEMLEDDQVSTCVNLKRDLILGSGFDLVQDGDQDQEEAIKFLYKMFSDDLEGDFFTRLEEILGAYNFGFSLTEKVFKKNDSGKITLKSLKTRHPNSWLIYQDDYGNITKYEQRGTRGNVDISSKSLIHLIANEKFQNPYGSSDLKTCYAAWFAKRQVIRYYAIYLEKAAAPIPIGRYEQKASSLKDDLLNMLKKFQTKTSIVIPKEIEVEFLEAKTNGEAYSKAINIFNMFIGRALFVPDLLGLTGSETGGGSFSLGIEQIKIFFMHINRRRTLLETLIQKNFIVPVCKYNFGIMDYYPCFKLKPIEDTKAIELAKVWLDAVKSKVWKATDEEVNYFRSLVNFPEGEVEIQETPIPIFGVPPGSGGQKPEPDNDEEIDREISSSDIEDDMKPKEFGKIFDFPKGNYHKKCDFKAIEAKLDDYDNSVKNEIAPVVKKIYTDIFDQIAKKKIIKNQEILKADTIKVKYLKELKTILKASFMGIYKDGQMQAQSEIFKSNFRQPLTSQEFLDMLEQETFSYIGDWEYNVVKSVKQELVKAIKDGKPLSSVLDILDNEGRKLSEQSIERYSRTKHTEVMNNGRLAFFESTDIVTGYQYSALLDERTSDICRGLNGKIFKAGTQPVPPLHFNCRSLLIPITKYEEFTPDETVGKTPINEFIETNKGKGFSTF